jgi:hypothetical protein
VAEEGTILADDWVCLDPGGERSVRKGKRAEAVGQSSGGRGVVAPGQGGAKTIYERRESSYHGDAPMVVGVV